jgi:hypothetical protein
MKCTDSEYTTIVAILMGTSKVSSMKTSAVNTEVGLERYTVCVYIAEQRTLHNNRRENINSSTCYLHTVSLCPLDQQRLLLLLSKLSKVMGKVKKKGGEDSFSVHWTLCQTAP